MKLILGKSKILLTTAFILLCAYVLAQTIVAPDNKTIAVVLFLSGAFVVALIKQENIVYGAIFLIFFFYKKNIPAVYNATNVIILMTAGILFARSIIESDSVISVKKIVRNPFWLASCGILISYLISWIVAADNQLPGWSLNLRYTYSSMDYHTSYLISIFCALLFGNIIIGFVQNATRSKTIQHIFLALLIANLLVGLVSWLKPDLWLIQHLVRFASGTFGSNVVAVGGGDDFAIRLGGLTFFWEAYAEYLMMAAIVLLGYLISLRHRQVPYLRTGIGFLLLLTMFELMLTNTRGATILAAVGLIVVVLTHSALSIRSRVASVMVLIAIAGTVLWLAFLSGQFTLMDRFSNFNEMEQTEFGSLPVGRAMVWLPTLRHIAENGLTGSGPSFYTLTPYLGGMGFLEWPHNLLLIILATIGVVGLGAFSYLFYQIIKLKNNLTYDAIGSAVYFYKYLWISIIFFFIDTMKYDGFLRRPDNYFYFMWFVISFMFSSVNFNKNNIK